MSLGVRVRNRTGKMRIIWFEIGWIEAVNKGHGSLGRVIIENDNTWFGFGLNKTKRGLGLGVN